MYFNEKVLRSWSEIRRGNCSTFFCAFQFFPCLPSSSFHHVRWTALHQCSGRWSAVLHLAICNKRSLNGEEYFYLGSKVWCTFLSFFFFSSAWMSKRQELKINSRNLTWLCKRLPLNVIVTGKAGIICSLINLPLLTEALIIAFWGRFFCILIQLKTFQDYN